MQTIFNMTSDYLKAHFKGSTYLEGSGSFDHSIVSAMWTLGGNQELLDTYHQALEDHGIEDKSLAPALRLTTSDVALPQVSGYTYTESDREEYIQAYSLSSNDTIRNEVNGMDQSLLSIKNKKFPSALPVLTMISSENVQNVPAWETAHRNQLDLESGNHQLYIVNGGHYIWYTNLTQVVQLIDEWRIENHF